MKEPNREFSRIADLMAALHGDVLPGKMMSSPALTCNGKVFAFHGGEGMGFRLGPNAEPLAMGVKNPEPLSPFKTKPPLRGWWIVGVDEAGKWQLLADRALEFTRTL